MSLDWDKLRIQSLLICERILGTSHKDMIWRLIYRGASYADSLQFQRCIDLWKYALELRVRRDSILWCDTCFLGQTLARYDHQQHQNSIKRIKLISSASLLKAPSLTRPRRPGVMLEGMGENRTKFSHFS